MEPTNDLLALAMVPGLGPRRLRELTEHATPAEIFRRPELWAELPARAQQALRAGGARRDAEAEARRAAASGVAIVGRDEPRYPAALREIYDPPPVLWIRGRLEPDDDARAVAVVGSRATSAEGRALARTLGRDVARAGWSVVSGLARGIDVEAHLGALDAGGRTVAVLGSGLGCIYPPEHRELALRIAASGGAVVSEYPLEAGPQRGNFPRRNRVIAGWCQAVVVVEAPSRSGALITARSALDEGRDVLAVPHHPLHTGGEGTNALIRDGATLVRHAGDVLEALGTPDPGVHVVDSQRLPAWIPEAAPFSVDDLQARSGLTPGAILAAIGEWTVAGDVRRLPGALYIRTSKEHRERP